jgi:hypothetical protein
MTNERLEVTKNDNKKEIWFFPFRWYTYKWGKSYEPYRKDRWIIDNVKEWHRLDITNSNTNI